MKTSRFPSCFLNHFVCQLACLLLFLLLPQSRGAMPVVGTNEDFSAVSRAVVKLLQSHDTARFASELAPSFEDFQSVASTNLAVNGESPLKRFQNTAKHGRQQLESSAKTLLTMAESLHLDFSKGTFRAQVDAPNYLGTMRFSGLQAENETIPVAGKVEVVLVPASGAHGVPKGEYKITVRRLLKFPEGWRCYGGVQWAAFPASVADEKTSRELTLLNKIATYKGFNAQDDPALLELGNTLVHFLRDRDPAVYEKEALFNSDLIWAQFQKSGRKGPSRQEIDQEVNTRLREQVKLARSVLQQMDDAGIDLKGADIQIKNASVEHGQPTGAPGSLDGLIGEQFKLTLAVKTDKRARNGTPLSGDYVLAANQLTRFGDDWRVMNGLHWYQWPTGIADKNTAAAMKFEDYVAEHRTLPPGITAPDIEFTTLDGGKTMKLSDLRGKVVVLDFWATWCGPCQEPMAKLQTLRQEHPDWEDRVAIVPLSIDDTIAAVRKHVNQRSWTNTFNVWAGDGGWRSAPAKAFRITAVPTTYIINGQGKIIKAGHPAAMNIGREVDALLASANQ